MGDGARDPTHLVKGSRVKVGASGGPWHGGDSANGGGVECLDVTSRHCMYLLKIFDISCTHIICVLCVLYLCHILYP